MAFNVADHGRILERNLANSTEIINVQQSVDDDSRDFRKWRKQRERYACNIHQEPIQLELVKAAAL